MEFSFTVGGARRPEGASGGGGSHFGARQRGVAEWAPLLGPADRGQSPASPGGGAGPGKATADASRGAGPWAPELDRRCRPRPKRAA